MSIKELHKQIQSFVDEYEVNKFEVLFNKGNQITVIAQGNKEI